MPRHHKPRRTNDKQIAGVDRIDATPEEIAQALFKQPPARKFSNPPKDKRRGPTS